MGSKPAVILTIAGDADKLQQATKQATKHVDDMGSTVAKQSDATSSAMERGSGRMSAAMALAGGAIGGLAVTGAQHLFQLSRSMEAMDVKARTVFEGELPAMQAWAEQNRRAFGASTREVVNMAANLADLLKPMGFTSAQAADMSRKILDLSGALSRWSGGTKTAAEVSELLADAMLGETDGLKALGISISAAEVDAKALSMGLGKTTVDMTKVREATLGVEKAQRSLSDALSKHGQGSLEARDASLALEKAQSAVKEAMAGGNTEIDAQGQALATQQLILEKSTDAQKAWAEGGREAAEKQNALSSTMAESSEKLSAIVTPAFSKLVEVLTAVAEWVSKNEEAAIAIGAVTAAVWLLNIALNANPIILVISGLVLLGTALVVLWTKSETFRNIVTGVWDAVAGAVSWAVNTIISIWDGAVLFFGGLPDRIGRAMGGLGSIISNIFKGAVNIMIDALNWGIRRINDIIYRANVINPFENIPYIPQVARMHTGGTVPGAPGTEQLILARAGEHVSAPGQGGGRPTELRVTGTGALAELIDYMVRSGQIQPR